MTHFWTVNRHLRQAKRRRRQLAGYRHRIAAALVSSPTIAGMMHAVVEHDGWCAIYQNCSCSCTPNISLIPVDGGHGVYVIDERGQARKTKVFYRAGRTPAKRRRGPPCAHS